MEDRCARRDGTLNDFVDNEMARMSTGRVMSKLRSTGILVVLGSQVEELRRNVIGNLREQFGPKINGVPFSQLLQAGANSCRHGEGGGIGPHKLGLRTFATAARTGQATRVKFPGVLSSEAPLIRSFELLENLTAKLVIKLRVMCLR